MLESMRRQGASIFIYVIFGILIAVFVINFGPQRGNRSDVGCTGTTNQVIAVGDSTPSVSAYHIAYANPFNRGQNKERTYIALETLIRRELLASAAEERNLLVTDDLINDEIQRGYFFLGGQRTQPPGMYEEIEGERFYTRLKSWIGQFNVSHGAYIEEQKRSLLAAMMAEQMTGSIQVSREEALARFLFENNTVAYDAVAFTPDTYRAAMKLTDADVDRFMSTHEDEVKARYKADERTYKAVKPQLQLRQIFIAKVDAPKAEDKKEQPNKDDKKKQPAPITIDEAKAKLEAARTAIAAGKQKFADAAKDLSSDDAAKSSGGDLGWRLADNPALDQKVVSDAVKTLKPGEMTPVVTTDRGAYLVMADAKREGDLSYDQVKHDLAKDLARQTWSKEAAKRAALAALDSAKTGMVHELDKLYQHDAAPAQPNMDLERILNDPNMSEEDKKQLLQMLLQQRQQGGAHGEIEVESKDHPAAWYADGDGAGAGSGSATGSATSAPAPTPAPAPADVPLTPSKDQLPAFGEISAPKVHRFGPAPRASELPGVGKSKAAVAALFDELKTGELGKQVYDAEGSYVIVQLVARQQPNVADFDKEADTRVAELREKRASEMIESWLKDRCETLFKEGKIKPNLELIRESDDKGNPLPPRYRPCSSFR